MMKKLVLEKLVKVEVETERMPETCVSGVRERPLALQILTNRVQWDRITNWMSGWPYALIQVQWTNHTEIINANPDTSKIVAVSILTPSSLVRLDNERVFRIAHKLARSNPVLSWHPNLQFDGVLRAAVKFNCPEILAWVVRELSTDPAWICEPDLMRVAVRESSTEVIRTLQAVCPPACVEFSPAEIDALIADGNVKSLRAILACDQPLYEISGWALVEAAGYFRYGATEDDPCVLEMVECVLRAREARHWLPFAYANGALGAAATNGRLAVVETLHNARYRCTTAAMDRAAEHGHLNVVKFLHEKRMEGCTTNAMDGAASRGHLAVVKFLHENRTEGCTVDAMDGAAVAGHLDVVRFLHGNRTEGCTAFAMNEAARNGDLEMVRFLSENRSESSCATEASDAAVRHGHFNADRFLHDNRTEDCAVGAQNVGAWDGHHVADRPPQPASNCSVREMLLAATHVRHHAAQYFNGHNSINHGACSCVHCMMAGNY